jgi:predicted enzyme related to lactoylglutathione lyase
MEDRRWKIEAGGRKAATSHFTNETNMTPDYAAFEHANVSGGIASGETSKSGAPLVILYASKLEEAQARVEKAGGKIVKPIFSFPGGRRFHFTDPAGNELAIWSDH